MKDIKNKGHSRQYNEIVSEKERTKNRKINGFDVKNRKIPDNLKIVFRFYELIFVSYLLLNNYRKHFFWNVNVDFVYKMFPIIHLRKYVLFYSAPWLCYLPPLSLDYYTSYENSSIEQVQSFSLSQWVMCGDVYNSSLQRKTWRTFPQTCHYGIYPTECLSQMERSK